MLECRKFIYYGSLGYLLKWGEASQAEKELSRGCLDHISTFWECWPTSLLFQQEWSGDLTNLPLTWCLFQINTIDWVMPTSKKMSALWVCTIWKKSSYVGVLWELVEVSTLYTMSCHCEILTPRRSNCILGSLEETTAQNSDEDQDQRA